MTVNINAIFITYMKHFYSQIFKEGLDYSKIILDKITLYNNFFFINSTIIYFDSSIIMHIKV